MIKFLQYLLIILIVGADFSTVSAQPIRNLDFEEVGVVNPQAPLGWTSRNFGQEISHDSVVVQSVTIKKNIDTISREAMKSQRASFRIEGMNIPKKRAEQIRREVVREFQNDSTSSNS